MVTSGEREGGRGKIGIGIKRYKLLCIKLVRYKNILYNREYSQYFIIIINGV